MLKKNKINNILFGLSTLIFILILLLSISGDNNSEVLLDKPDFKSFPNNWNFIVNNQTKGSIILPVTNQANANDIVLLKNTLPNNINHGDTLFLRVVQSKVRVFCDNKLIYTYGYDNVGFFKKIPGSFWLPIPITPNMLGKEITFEFVSPYKHFSGSINSIFITNKASIISYILKSGLLGFIISFIMLILGIISIIVSLFMIKIINSRKLLYLGFFSIFFSIWTLGELRVLQLFYGNITFFLNMTFLSLLLGMISFLLFLSSFKFYEKSRALHWLIRLSILIFILINFLHLFNIKDYIQTVFLTHGIVLLTLIYVAVKFFRHLIRGKIEKDILFLNINLFILFTIALTDLFSFYLSVLNKIGMGIRIGLCYFIAAMTIFAFKQISKAFEEKLEISILKKIAYHDALTNIYNRRAFEEKIKSLESEKIKDKLYTIVTLDMNCLKNINDSYGHHSGDAAIIFVSETLTKIFDTYGSCYRLGGDEFCIICRALSKNELQYLIDTVNNLIMLNEFDFAIKPLVAYGFAYYKSGDNLNEVLKEADKLMYDCKLEMKSIEISQESENKGVLQNEFN